MTTHRRRIATATRSQTRLDVEQIRRDFPILEQTFTANSWSISTTLRPRKSRSGDRRDRATITSTTTPISIAACIV